MTGDGYMILYRLLFGCKLKHCSCYKNYSTVTELAFPKFKLTRSEPDMGSSERINILYDVCMINYC